MRWKGISMPALVLVGAQWGDEGKGKATDLLGGSVDYVVRYQGGNNAGHTVVIGDQKYALHLLPSGILTPGCVPVIGNGVVIDPAVLFAELDGLTARGVDTSRLLISANAHLITPYHRTMDKVTRAVPGQEPRSAPPAAASARPTRTRSTGSASGSRTCSTRAILRAEGRGRAARPKNQMLVKVYNRRAIERRRGRRGVPGLRRAAAADRRRHLAGAEQGAGRGTRSCCSRAARAPCSTSTTAPIRSSPRRTRPRAAPAPAPASARPASTAVIGILKAYTTRVGAGPFPTELFDEDGERAAPASAASSA